MTIANELTPARLRATGQALMKSTMFGLAPIVGAFGGGLIYQTLGARLMFLGSTLVVAAAGAVVMVAIPSRATSAEPQVLKTAEAPATP